MTTGCGFTLAGVFIKSTKEGRKPQWYPQDRFKFVYFASDGLICWFVFQMLSQRRAMLLYFLWNRHIEQYADIR